MLNAIVQGNPKYGFNRFKMDYIKISPKKYKKPSKKYKNQKLCIVWGDFVFLGEKNHWVIFVFFRGDFNMILLKCLNTKLVCTK